MFSSSETNAESASLTNVATKREDGEDFPAAAFAYTPDLETPSTWKLRLWDSLDERETAAQVGRAVAALGVGFRGQRVDIPSDALAGVKARVLAAWLATHPDSTRDDAPAVLKGFEQMPLWRDDDNEIDPFDELLDAYQAFVRAGAREFADRAMTIVHELQNVMLGSDRDMSKGHVMGYSNPVACLAQAWLVLSALPDMRPIAESILELMRDAAESMSMVGPGSEMNDDETTDGDPGVDRMVRREIVVEDGVYCVVSETGRRFGCYTSMQAAQDRLAQIERFSDAVVASESVERLVAFHAAAHRLDVVTADAVEAHDVICDVLEVVHGRSEPYALPSDLKVAMLSRLDAGFVAKAAEHRFTLGPAYVPDVEDAHGEFTDAATLQRAMWDWVRKGDRTIYLQHSNKAAGEMVEMMTLPFAVDAELVVPGEQRTKYSFPADTPFIGVIWEPWAWELVKRGELRGYSIGGSARRMTAELPDTAVV